jgi:CMP-N,N'-diacetyllegionaminic acid synthase
MSVSRNEMQKILAVIPARGGSRGIPGKNLIDVGGKPLIEHTINSALESRRIDKVIVSTDSEEIASKARSLGVDVPYMRAKSLSEDNTPSSLVILDAIKRIPGYSVVLMLQPTSPLRTGDDIENALDLFMANDKCALISVSEDFVSPYWSFSLRDDGNLAPLFSKYLSVGRQKLPKTYSPNGAIYISQVKDFEDQKTFFQKQLIPYLMPVGRSIDIDDYSDLELARNLILQNQKTSD